MKQAVFQLRALDLDIIGQLELALEAAAGDPLVEELAAGIVSFFSHR